MALNSKNLKNDWKFLIIDIIIQLYRDKNLRVKDYNY